MIVEIYSPEGLLINSITVDTLEMAQKLFPGQSLKQIEVPTAPTEETSSIPA